MKKQYYVSISKFVFIMVGMVISGQYFGWNAGIDTSNPSLYIYAVLLLVVFFSIFIFGCAILTHYFMGQDKSITELVGNVLGIRVGFFTGMMCYLEYWFATPAIAIAFAIYIKGFFPLLPHSIAILISFTMVFFSNIGNLKYIAKIETIATVIALFGVMCFYYVGFTDWSIVSQVTVTQSSVSMGGFGKAISFAIWLFLGIEGGITLMHAMKTPKKDGVLAIIIGLIILAVLAISTSLIFIKLSTVDLLLDANPLPSLAIHLGHTYIYAILVFTGLVGIMASFNGLTIGYIQQHKMLAKNYGFTNSKFTTMYLPLFIALMCSLSNDLSQGFVILSVSCAIVVYALVWLSVIKLTYSLKKYKVLSFYLFSLPLMIFVGICTFYYGALSTSIELMGFKILTAYLLLVIALFILMITIIFGNYSAKFYYQINI